MRRFVERLCATAADADDVMQETMTRAWKYRASWDPDRDAAPWLLRTAFRAATDHRDRARRTPAPLDGSESERAEPCALELREEIEYALRHLSVIERTLLLGFHREGLSIEELAHAHDLPLNTVKSHLHRARRKLPGGRR